MRKIKKIISMLLSVLLITSIITSISNYAAATEVTAGCSVGTSAKYMFGDLSGDERISVADLDPVIRYLNNEITFTLEQEIIADVNGNGIVDSGDRECIIDNILSGTEFPIYDLLLDYGYCGETVKYMLKKDGTLTVFGEGNMDDYYFSELFSDIPSRLAPWNTYSSQITNIILTDGVKTIGSRAFYGCKIHTISIPDTVTSVGNYAFYGCSELTSVSLSSNTESIGTYAFYNCSKLTEISIPTKVNSIGIYAFARCSALTSISLPNGITSISNYLFYECSALKNVSFSDNVTIIGDNAFHYCTKLTNVTVPSKLKTIGQAAFRCCYVLTNMSIPSGVTSIGSEAFSNCLKGFISITIPSQVTRINDGVFKSCRSLTSVDIHSDVTYIGKDAFFDCNNLTEISIPNKVTEICDGVFDGCKNLKSITIPKNVTSIGKSAFEECISLTSITIPENVTYIGEFAFNGCSGLTSITIPERVTTVDQYAFSRCSNLVNATLSDGVMNLGDYAFNSCFKLTKIIIPESVTNIGKNAFIYSTKVTIHGDEDSRAQSYAEENNIPFQLIIRSISDCIIILNPFSYQYDGTAKQPTITVQYGSKTLVEGKDYIVTCPSAINVNTYDVTITGKGRFSGTATESFSIDPKSIENFAVMLSQTSYTYDGTEKKPSITIKDGSKTLTKNTDYNVFYYDNTNAGRATVAISGKGNYAGNIEKTFTINAKSLTGCTVTLTPNSCTYDENGAEPYVNVMDGARVLSQNWDYTVKYSNNKSIGTATATITGKDNYYGTITKTFDITPKSIFNTTITLSQTTYTYDGTEKKPTVTVKDDKKTLTLGTDYTVGYTDNKDSGTATVTVTGIGVYTETTTRTFTINPKSVSGLTITLGQTSYTYDGNEKKPSVTVKDGSKTLSKETDYTVSYSDNVNAGTATVTVLGKNNYKDSVNKSFTISKKSISNAKVTLSPSSCTYEGTEVQPYVTVEDGTRMLSENFDYSVSYDNNNKVGTANVTITGKDNYYGTITRTFEIVPKSIFSTTITLSETTYIYDGTEKEPSVTVKDGTKTLTNGTDYKVTYLNNKKAGTATVEIEGIGNYKDKTSRTFTINPKSMSDITVTLAQMSYTYDGVEKRPSVTVKSGATRLKENTDYSLYYSDNLNVGTAKVTVTLQGNYSGTVAKDFTIIPASILDGTVTLNPDSYIYNGTEVKPYVVVEVNSRILTSDFDYTYSYSNNKNAGNASVTIVGKGNYNGTVKKAFTITPKSISGATVTLSETSYTYDGTEKKPSVTVKDGTKTLTKNTDYEVSYKDNINSGTATVVIRGKGNYKDKVTKHFIITADSFLWGADNWSFDNSGRYFNNHDVDKNTLNALTRDFGLSRTEYSQLKEGIERNNRLDASNGFIGSCFGMTVSEILAKQGDLNLSTYGGNAIVNNNSNTTEMLSLINFIQCMQHVGRMGQILRQTPFLTSDSSQSSFVDKLETTLSNNSSLLHISYTIVTFDKRKGKTTTERHAVLGYGVENCNYYSTVTGKNYNKRILIADPNCLSKNALDEEACIYFQSSTYSWICPYQNEENNQYSKTCYWNSSSGNDTSKGALNSIMRYDSLTDAKNLMTNDTDHYIAGLSVKADGSSSSYVEQQKSSGNPEYDYGGGSGFGIAKYSGDYSSDESVEKEERYALWNQTANYSLSYDEPTDFELSMDYENLAYFAEIENGTYVLFKPSGDISLRGSNANYSVSLVTNDNQCVTDWYDVNVSGSKVDNLEFEKVRNGYILTASNLNNVTISVQNDVVNISRTFSTDYDSVFVYEIDENTIGLKVDTDGDGSFDTEIPNEEEDLLIGDVNLDGNVTISDVTEIQKHLAEFIHFSDDLLLIADTNGDGVVNISDATHLQKYLAEFEGIVLGKQ